MLAKVILDLFRMDILRERMEKLKGYLSERVKVCREEKREKEGSWEERVRKVAREDKLVEARRNWENDFMEDILERAEEIMSSDRGCFILLMKFCSHFLRILLMVCNSDSIW
jgi:hypothetical protein